MNRDGDELPSLAEAEEMGWGPPARTEVQNALHAAALPFAVLVRRCGCVTCYDARSRPGMVAAMTASETRADRRAA